MVMRTTTRPRQALSIILLAAGVVAAACQGLPTPSERPGADETSAAPSPLPTPPGLAIVGGPFVAPTQVCAGPKPWTGVPGLVVRLAEAWHEHDGVKRRPILDEVFAEDGLYQDPYGFPTNGRDAFWAVMGYGVAPGQYIELLAWDDADIHHDTIRMAWRHCCPSGLSLLEGTDIATVGPDGRFSRIVSFWSRYVDEPAEGACDGPRITTAPSSPPASDAARQACQGSDVDWSGVPPVAQGYGKAWNERDPEARRALLDEVWAEDGTYVDVMHEAPVRGRDAFDAEIGGFIDADFGAYFEPRPTVDGDSHNGFLRMPWTFCDDAGNVVWVGEDIADLDADGRIAKLVGFFVP